MNYTREDPLPRISHLQQCLSMDKRPIGLFLGAGCPMSIQDENQCPLIPDIAGISKLVREQLQQCAEHRNLWGIVDGNLKKDGNCDPTVEDFLSHVRALEAVVGNDEVRGLSAQQLQTLDSTVCNLIHRTVNKKLPSDQTPYHSVSLWAHATQREFPIEIFTTNYDLLLEQALEESRVPYFDGFSGVLRPLFDPLLLEGDLPPWTRLWKLHGSINWYQNESREVFRGTAREDGPRRVIHPSHLKYQESRRMPYLAMVDRFRSFLKLPNAVLILCGYSFRDDHINETIIQGLQHTQTAVAFALMFGQLEGYDNAVNLATNQPNLNVLACNGGIIGGRRVEWLERDSESLPADTGSGVTWEQTASTDGQPKYKAEFKLGDFAVFGKFLQEIVGNAQSISIENCRNAL